MLKYYDDLSMLLQRRPERVTILRRILIVTSNFYASNGGLDFLKMNEFTLELLCRVDQKNKPYLEVCNSCT